MIFLKFRCEKNVLQTAVTTVSRAAASKSAIAAMEGILFETKESGLKLTAYDTRIGIYTDIEAEIQEEGRAVLPAKFLADLVRRLPDGMVSVETDDSLTAFVRCGKTELQLMGYDPEDYPNLDRIDEIHRVTIPEGILKSMINQTIFAVATSEVRPIYTGVLFEVTESELTMVAIDGYRMAKRSERLEDAGMDPCTFIIPGSTLAEVEKLCSQDENRPVSISLGEKQASFSVGSTVLIGRRLEGEFMNYRKSIPTSFRYEVIVEREELMRVVDRVSLVIKEKQTSPIRMIVEDGNLFFSCTTGFGHAEDSCLCDGSGEGMRIGFNDRYFMDALRAANEEKLRLSLNTPSAPIIIQAAEGGKYLYMVLPVRLRDGD